MAEFNLSAEVKLQGLFLSDPKKALSIFEEEFGKALGEASSLMLFEVDKRTPRGMTGNLAGSLSREIRGSGFDMQGVVGTPLYYAERVEMGTPYEPNLGALIDWTKWKFGLDVQHAWAVAKVIRANIKRKGMEYTRWMFKKGFEAGEKRAQGILDKAADRINERWS